jgi:hypothetical protein
MEANTDSGRFVMDTPITAGMIVVGAVAILVVLHRVVIKIK